MACDICGKTGTHLEDLMDSYKTDDIQQICSDCSSKVNKHLWKLRDMTSKMNQSFLKKLMGNLKSKFRR
jgi:protein-arginine kinase activator protein McsA